MAELIKQEVAKVFKATQLGKEGSVNFIHTTEFACMANNSRYIKGVRGSWIIDTSASNHICANLDFFDDLTTLTSPIYVHLPNGNVTQVTQVGSVYFNNLKLTDTLFLQTFCHNLLSMNKLTITNLISCTFFPCFCIL